MKTECVFQQSTAPLASACEAHSAEAGAAPQLLNHLLQRLLWGHTRVFVEKLWPSSCVCVQQSDPVARGALCGAGIRWLKRLFCSLYRAAPLMDWADRSRGENQAALVHLQDIRQQLYLGHQPPITLP